jgi:starch phosphorylase
MRLLVDVEGLEWEKAWKLTQGVFGYTNHTLMPEALEKWSVELFGRVLPRHLEIVYDINFRFLQQVTAKYPGDVGRMQKMSIIEEGREKWVRMAHLAVVGSHSVNGVSALHGRLLRERLFPEFDAMFPGRFNSKTNGITPRRWLLSCNPGLASLIAERIGTEWPAFRELPGDTFVKSMRQPLVIDPNWFLAGNLKDDRRILYCATGKDRKQ